MRWPWAKPASIDLLIEYLQRTFPSADIKVTDGLRTIKDQAEVMLGSALVDSRSTFLTSYGNAPYATEMLDFLDGTAFNGGPSRRTVLSNPSQYTRQVFDKVRRDTLLQFESIIRDARKNGSQVSDHLDNFARDIKLPKAYESEIFNLLTIGWGARVLSSQHGTGPHWHITYRL